MKTKSLFSILGRLLIGLVFIFALFQYFSKNDGTHKYPEDMPISDFIIGKWKMVSVFDVDNGNTITVEFPGFNFLDERTVIYSDFQSIYKFIEPDKIAVDNGRVIGVEKWRLEREGNNLVIYIRQREFILERCLGFMCALFLPD